MCMYVLSSNCLIFQVTTMWDRIKAVSAKAKQLLKEQKDLAEKFDKVLINRLHDRDFNGKEVYTHQILYAQNNA